MAAMGVMFWFITLAMPVFITVILFLGFIAFGIFSFVYTGEFWLYDDKLEEKLTPRLSFMPFLKPQHRYYNWSELESYLLDTDLNYSGSNERRYLKLYFINPKREVIINEGNNTTTKEQFINFATAFVNLTGTSATPPLEPEFADISSPISTPAPSGQPTINARKRKGFYQKPIAKILALFFIVVTSTLLAVYYFPSIVGIEKIGFTSAWRIWAVLVPGTLYFSARAFSNKP